VPERFRIKKRGTGVIPQSCRDRDAVVAYTGKSKNPREEQGGFPWTSLSDTGIILPFFRFVKSCRGIFSADFSADYNQM